MTDINQNPDSKPRQETAPETPAAKHQGVTSRMKTLLISHTIPNWLAAGIALPGIVLGAMLALQQTEVDRRQEIASLRNDLQAAIERYDSEKEITCQQLEQAIAFYFAAADDGRFWVGPSVALITPESILEEIRRKTMNQVFDRTDLHDLAVTLVDLDARRRGLLAAAEKLDERMTRLSDEVEAQNRQSTPFRSRDPSRGFLLSNLGLQRAGLGSELAKVVSEITEVNSKLEKTEENVAESIQRLTQRFERQLDTEAGFTKDDLREIGAYPLIERQ